MNNQAMKFRLGVFVLGAALLLGVLIILFGQFPAVFRSQLRYAVVLTEAPGVESGTPVRKSGVRIGEVTGVDLQPDSGEILMAPPFSAVPTPFVVATSRHLSYANCAWDAIGVPIMLREEAQITSSCGCCGASVTLDVAPDRPPFARGVMHFAVPAAQWWHDLVYT